MSDIEKVVMRTRKIESLLRTQYHAEGKGLHQLITSCEERLPHDVISKLRFIATIRNKIVHEHEYKLENRNDFLLNKKTLFYKHIYKDLVFFHRSLTNLQLI